MAPGLPWYLLACEGCTLGYVPDCSELSAAVVARCRGCDVMILDGLRHRPHATHLTVTQSVAWLQAIGAKRSFLVHMGHDLDHAATEAALPPGIKLSYDGLEVAW